MNMAAQPQANELAHYNSSLKEIEAIIRGIRTGGGAASIDSPFTLPSKWAEVLHMARIAPGMLSCLRECRHMLDSAFQGAVTNPVPEFDLRDQSGDFLTDLKCLLDTCESVIQVATAGAVPPPEKLH